MGLKKRVKGLFGKGKSISELESSDQQSLQDDCYFDTEESLKKILGNIKNRDILNQEIPTEEDFNKITDILDRCTIDEYDLVKSSDGYHIVRKKSLNERLNEIYRNNSSADWETRTKGKSKEEKSR